MNASMRERKQSRQSSASTWKTNVRKSAGSGVAISATRQGGNSNIQQTTKAPGQTTSLATGVRRVSELQAASSSMLASNNTSSTVSNSGITVSVHASNNSYKNNSFINNNNNNENNNNNNNNKDSALFFLNSLNEALDVKFNEFFNKNASLPAGDADLLKNLYGKLTSLESQVKHQGFLLGHMNLELNELRKTNAEQFKEIVTLRSREACSESINSNFNVNNSMGELGGNTAPNLHIPVNPPSSSLPSPTTSLTLPPLDGSEVVNTGELIITNFIDGEVTDYNRLARTVLVALDPSITDSDVIFARPLSIVPRSIEQTSQPRRRIAVLLSSASLVNRVLLAKTKRTRFCTDDLDLSPLGVEVSSRAKTCKIFVNEALSKERYKLFCNLRSAAKGLGIKYVWHRGGKFMARMRSGDRVHVFESLSDLLTLWKVFKGRLFKR